jgi:hypothetical protein
VAILSKRVRVRVVVRTFGFFDASSRIKIEF